MTARTPHVRSRTRDPLLLAAIAVLVGLIAWTAAPSALGSNAAAPMRVDLGVETQLAVTPGWTAGDASVRLEALVVPGQSADVASRGWKLFTNAPHGYEVRVRTTTTPAMRGANAIDGRGANASFADFTSKDCPCPWRVERFDSGVFGYSVSVETLRGRAAEGDGKWQSTGGQRAWRGLTEDGFRAYSTPGGSGAYEMTMHFRSEIPARGAQLAGSYRTSLVNSVHPLL